MRPFRWLKLRRKSLPDLPLLPPIWLGSRSNGEYFHEQDDRDRRLSEAILRKADENARRIGWDRRHFLASSMGMATSLWVVNQLAGCTDGGGYQVPPDAMAGECTPLDASKEFILDLQTHHVNPAGGWRESNPIYELFLGYLPQKACGEMDNVECFSSKHYIEEMFLNSDTTVAVLSSVPADECLDSADTGCGTPLTNEEIVATRELVNSNLARSQRILNHCMVMPNLDQAKQFAEMEEMHATFGVAAWKCYTPWGPTGVGWWLDDPAVGIPFIEKGRALGVKIFCCHKGFPLPGFDAVHTDPRDIGVVATMFPDVSFIVYHSAYQFGGPDGSGENTPEGPYDPLGLPETANIGVNSLIKALEDNGLGKGSNVFAELGSLWGSVMTKPDEAQHVMGKLLKHLGEDNVVWGTDCIWTGSPQPQIEAFRAFSISQQMQDTYGYPALTDDIKRKIFGLNAARVFGIDVNAARCAVSASELEQARRLLDDDLGPRRWAFRRPPGPTSRRELLGLLRSRGGRPA